MKNSDPIRLFEDPEISSTLTAYLREDPAPAPAILICPGGGYENLCERAEGEPIARRFNELGFQAFVLDYRIAPDRFPAPLHDGIRALQMIRKNAAEWNVIPDRVAVCGFSAGGHLCGMLGTIGMQIAPEIGIDPADAKPDGLILSYAVLSMLPPNQHTGSRLNLLGEDAPEDLCRLCSPIFQVNGSTPPAFVWQTFHDSQVPYPNAIEFSKALMDRNIPCELHIYPLGDHGLQLGLGSDVESWSGDAARFLITQWEIRDGNSREIFHSYSYNTQYKRAKIYRSPRVRS